MCAFTDVLSPTNRIRKFYDVEDEDELLYEF